MAEKKKKCKQALRTRQVMQRLQLDGPDVVHKWLYPVMKQKKVN